MKKLALPLLVLLLGFMIYQEVSKKEPLEEADKPTRAPKPKFPAAPKVSSPQVPAPVVKPPAPAVGRTMIPEKRADGRRPKPPKGSIPFERHGDLVVAFGDVLLGKPTTENFPEKGFIEAPPLNTWPKGVIGYSFQQGFNNPERVMRVLAYFNEYTPIKFVPFKDQTDSIVFAPSPVPLCLSYVGRIQGHQPIYLDDRCGEREITHEIMHALGFIHEQSRPDRDNFVVINWDKIEEDKQSQFEIAPTGLSEPSKGRPFDYQSVMIYSPTTFARQRGDMTMESRTGTAIEPTNTGLSPEDLQRLILLYAR